MINQELTLNHFFTHKGKKMSEENLSLVDAEADLSALKEKITNAAGGIKWGLALKEMIDKIEDLLNIDLSGIMVKAWDKYSILLEYTDGEKHPPDETSLVSLTEHAITSEHHPYIEVLINNQSVGKLKFHIKVVLNLRGVVLKIQDGRIKGITAGDCKGQGAVSCENVLLLEKKLGSIPIGSIDLGDGIPIAPEMA